MTKKWYRSKTMWTNLSVIIAAAVTESIVEIIQPYIELIILAAVNIILRMITKERIEV